MSLHGHRLRLVELTTSIFCSYHLWPEDSTTDLHWSNVYLLFTLIYVMLICVKNKLFGLFNNDNSSIQPYLNRTKKLIFSSFFKSLAGIIFVCDCLVQYDLYGVTKVFTCQRAWLQKIC